MKKSTLMTRCCTALLAVAGLAVTAANAQPANDTCATAIDIASVPFASNVTNANLATSGLPDPSCNSTSGTQTGRFDVWYTFTPSAAGIATLGHTDTNDTVTTIWTNSASDCSGTWTQLSCTDSDASYQVANLVPGTKYWIQISMWSSTSTPSAAGYLWSFNYSVAPANDACASATALTVDTLVSGDSTAATNDGPTNTSTVNTCSATYFSTLNRTVWHTFTPATTGVFTISTCATTNFDNKIAIYLGSACTGTVASIACNDDSCGTRASLAVSLTAGQLYTIRLSGTGTGTAGGLYSILVTGPTVPPAPSNDDCLTPVVLSSGSPVSATLAGATGSSTTLATCGSVTTTGNDVWYSFTPTVAGTHTVAVCGNFDTVLSTHTTCTTASAVCNDDTVPVGCTSHGSQLTFTGAVGTPVLIRVGGVGPGTLVPEFGAFTITLTQPIVGACCFAGSCTITAQPSCTGESTFLGANTSCTPNVCPAPVAGDLCASPIVASLGSNLANNLLATTQPLTTLPTACSSRNGIKDIFFTFTPANSVNYSFTLCNATSGTLDTLLSVHTNSCPTTIATLVAAAGCNDDGCSGTAGPSAISNLPLVAGTTYIIRVANWSTTTTVGGPFDLQITSDPFGTCCNSVTGACRLSSSPTCNLANESFQGQAACSPNPCPPPPQACCTPAGVCSLVAPASCVSPSVAQGTGTTCSPNICPVAPANDLCANASVASLGANSGTAVGSSNDGRSSCDLSAGRDVWWSFNPTATGTYSLSLCASAASWDTVLSVHTACAADTSTQIAGACNDEGCGVDLSVISTITLNAGTNYLIRVAGWSSTTTPNVYTLTITQVITGACCSATTGACTLTTSAACTTGYQGDNTVCSPNPCPQPSTCCLASGVCVVLTPAQSTLCAGFGGTSNVATTCTPSPCGAPTNVGCTSASPLTLNVWALGNNNLSTNVAQASPAATCQATSSKDVWFSFVAPASTGYDISSCGSPQDTVLQVYTSPDCLALTAVVCDDDACAGTETSLIPLATSSGFASLISNQTITAGSTIYVRLSSFASTAPATGGNFQLRVSYTNAALVGSCCAPAGTCSLSDAANCTGGAIHTVAGVCSPNTCPQPSGRCCVGARCVAGVADAAACTALVDGSAGSVFTAGATDCNAPGVYTTPCCQADFNKTGTVTVQDIFDFLSGWFNGSANADINGSATTTVQDIFDFLSAWFGGCA